MCAGDFYVVSAILRIEFLSLGRLSGPPHPCYAN